MASTKRVNVSVSDQEKELVTKQLEQLFEQVKQKLVQYEKKVGKPYHIELKQTDGYDYINPQHYVQDDGRQTWEHMVDEFGLEETAIFCKLNAYKYSDRRGRKPGEDIEREDKKIKWYTEKAAELFALAEEQGGRKPGEDTKSLDDINKPINFKQS